MEQAERVAKVEPGETAIAETGEGQAPRLRATADPVAKVAGEAPADVVVLVGLVAILCICASFKPTWNPVYSS